MANLFLVHMYEKGIYERTAPFIFKNEKAAKKYCKMSVLSCEIQKTPILTEEDMKITERLMKYTK